ncbi:serine hydrolase [Psychroserpens damuponensis]|uniref:serine hydrolase n=1 Tax=Psychroserpens damuponensis TaxID=943936 RepID=UPI0005908247|nr:serine hydrolase [Psychroserpens damuponensis]
MKKLALLTLGFLITFSISAQDKRLKNIDKELNKILEETKAAGFAVAVVEGDKIIYSKGFGFRDYENKIPVDANTLFAIGSSTKAFTSSLLGLLRDEEKLTFDDNPRQHIPELEFYNDNLNNNIIIKDLMRHSTGIPRHDGSWYYFPSHDKDSLLMRLKHQEPFTGIRQQWYYNNFGFLAQGVITERITGKSWENNLKEHFFEPLEMSRTNATIAEMKTASNASFGYEVKNNLIKKMDYYDIAGMSPAGSINSSVNDMGKWLIAWLNDGKYKEKDIIPSNYLNEAISSQMVVSSNTPDDKFPNIHFGNYGYGWFLQSYKGHYRVDHGGNIDGFSANVAFFPTDNIGIVVLANQNGSPIPSLVRNTIADRMIDEAQTDWLGRYIENKAKGKKAQEDAQENSETSFVKNTKPSHINVDYTGSYYNEGYGKFDIYAENDSLFSKLNGNKIYLNHYHYDVFEMIDVSEGKVDTTQYGKSIKMTFLTNETGDISEGKIKIEPTVDAISFKRTPNTIDVDAKTLEMYTGTYDISGTEIKAYIKNDVLFLFVKGQPEYEQIATSKHKFSFKTLEGFKVEFLESEDGTIHAIKMFQPNGTFVANRKK